MCVSVMYETRFQSDGLLETSVVGDLVYTGLTTLYSNLKVCRIVGGYRPISKEVHSLVFSGIELKVAS